jgi:hypothetical protein
LRDACVRCERPNNVDKLLYRGSDLLELDAESWQLERKVFQSESGEPLSDHTPVAVGFSWSKREGGGPIQDTLRRPDLPP